jgi:hypothetical protein
MRLPRLSLASAIFIAILFGLDVVLLQFTPLDGVVSNPESKQYNEGHKTCTKTQFGDIPVVSTAALYGCTFIFKHLRFIDDFHDTINAISTLMVSIFTFTLWRATNKLWESGEKTVKAAHRAWVDTTISLGNGDLNIDRFRISIPIKCTIKNIGNSPAIYVKFVAYGSIYERDCHDAIIKSIEKFRNEPRRAGYTVLPNGEFNYPEVLAEIRIVPASDIEVIDEKDIYIWGFVGYTFSSDIDGFHFTPFMRRLQRFDGKAVDLRVPRNSTRDLRLVEIEEAADLTPPD